MKKAWLIIIVFIMTLDMNMAQSGGMDSSPLAGTWSLTAAEVIFPDGTVHPDTAYGVHAQGILMVDSHGRYSLQIYRPDRPLFSSGDKKKGTQEEYVSAFLGISTHTGNIEVDAAKSLLYFKIDYAAYPNWNHTLQIRKFRLSDDELYYEVPPAAGSGTTAISKWRRIR